MRYRYTFNNAASAVRFAQLAFQHGHSAGHVGSTAVTEWDPIEAGGPWLDLMADSYILTGFAATRLVEIAGDCPTCMTPHNPDQPHDANSLYYQMTFREEHGRWPDWRDALAHCDEETRGGACIALRARGYDLPHEED